jgi:transposase InsO family protein
MALDLQQRATQHGHRRHNPRHETENSRLNSTAGPHQKWGNYRWITTLTKADIKISMDGRGRYLNNIFIERLWRSLKQEAVYLHEITDGFQAKRIIDNWIEFYN